MIDRPHAFGEQKYSLLDNVIYALRRRQVVRRLPWLTNQTIADLGSGYDARLLVGLLNDFKDTEGVAFDIAFMPQLAETERLSLILGDLNQPLKHTDGSVDICICLAVLEHLDRPQEFLTEVYSVLKPGGRMVLTTPGPSSQWLLELLAFKLRIIDADEIKDHKNYFSSSDLHKMFVAAGFTPEKVMPQTFIFGMNNVVVADK